MPARARKEKGAVLAVSMFDGSLFGPQSRWSSLLGQREHLQNEITRGRRHLEQLRKDLADCDASLRSGPPLGKPPSRNGRLENPRQFATCASIEQFLSGWLLHLEDQLAAVVAEIQAVEQQSETKPIFPEESMYELLRAAG